MNPSTKIWQSIRTDQRVEIGLVHVDIGGNGRQHDQFTDLILKRAKDVLKDALIASAESRGGKLSSWQDDRGTFMFLIEGPESFNSCCLAAVEMLDRLSVVKREVRLSPDLERLMVMRIACDVGTVTYDPAAHILLGEFVDNFKKHEQVVSLDNNVTITDRIFRQLNSYLKSRFVKRKHSTELGADLYCTSADSEKAGAAVADLPSETMPAAARRSQDDPVPAPAKGSSARGWRALVSDALGSRTIQGVGAVLLGTLVILECVRFFAAPTTPPPVAPPERPPWNELVYSEEWLTWRKQLHEKLSAGKVTESVLAEALKIKLPARREHAAEALRRDQAIADVLMSYPDIRSILKKRYGIYEDTFLGTGLSKPFGASNYGAASVHEYLILNHSDNHPAVWMRVLDPAKNQLDMTMTVQELFEKDPNPDDQKKRLAEGIAQRVQENDMVSPAVIRFAILDLSKYSYSRKLGRADAQYVFVSNLAQVWKMRVRDAASLSGHTFTKGDSLYIWAFLPNHPDEVVLATWDEVLKHLPGWLSEIKSEP